MERRAFPTIHSLHPGMEVGELDASKRLSTIFRRLQRVLLHKRKVSVLRKKDTIFRLQVNRGVGNHWSVNSPLPVHTITNQRGCSGMDQASSLNVQPTFL